MKKTLALAGFAAALFTAVPMAAQADNYRHADGPRGHYERDVRRGADHDRRWDRGPDRHDYRKMKRRDFSYWRPALENRRYHHFGRPVFYDHYYRVPARDYRGHLVTLTINAYTGAILSVGY